MSAADQVVAAVAETSSTLAPKSPSAKKPEGTLPPLKKWRAKERGQWFGVWHPGDVYTGRYTPPHWFEEVK